MIFSELKPGKSVQGDKISAFKTEVKSSRYLYLIAGVHGDEVEGVYVLNELFTFLKKTTEIDLPMVVVPILNTDGYRAGTRLNAHGVDLNRNLPGKDWTSQFSEEKYYPGPAPLSEPENQFLLKLFEKYPPNLMLSFHSWKPMLNYNGDCKNIADFLAEFNHYPVVSDIGYPTPGSLGAFLPEKYHCPVLTFECPILDKDHTLKQVWEENKVGLEKLMLSKLFSSFLP